MSRKNRQQAKKDQTQQRNMIIGVGVVALVVAIAAGVLLSGGNDEPVVAVNEAGEEVIVSQKVPPQTYVDDLSSGEHILIDVRTPQEFDSGYIDGAININVDTLSSRLDEIPTDRPIILYCRSGNRSAIAADILAENGFTNIYDIGGVIDWTGAGYSLVQ